MVQADREISRLKRLIEDLLEFEKIQAGVFRLSPKPSCLSEVVLAAIDAVRPLAVERQLKLTNQVSDVSVLIDGGRIIQVLINLLTNAIKFSPPDSLVVIAIEQLQKSVKVSVQDYGRGIPEDSLHRVFTKYHQVKLEDSTRLGGVGLGLPICKEIIESHGGEVGVESNYGKGSKFWFTLPLIEGETVAQDFVD